MNVLVVAGHERTTGAVYKNLVEESIAKILADLVVKHLIAQGHKAEEAVFNLFNYLEKNGVTQELMNYDYILEIHFNAPGGSGSEIFVATGETKISVEKAIMQRMKKWFRLRDDKAEVDGVKEADYYILKMLKGKQEAALLEVAFIDNPAEMDILLRNYDAIAKDIAYGILEGFEEVIHIEEPKPVTPVVPVTMAPAGKLYRTVTGSYAVRENAEKQIALLKEKGFTKSRIVLVDDPRL